MDNKNWAEYERDQFWCEHFAKALHKKILSDEEYIELLRRVEKTLRMKHKIKTNTGGKYEFKRRIPLSEFYRKNDV